MTKKTQKFIIVAIAIVFIPVMVIYINVFGNPISLLLCRITSANYVKNNYPRCTVETVGYNFKDGNYFAKIKNENSKDIFFNIYTDFSGKVKSDTYKSSVLSGNNTALRIDMDYRKLVEAAVPEDEIDFTCDIFYGEILSEDMNKSSNSDTNHIMPASRLVTDKEYDYTDLSYKYGHIVLYAGDEDVSVIRACEILLRIKETLSEQNLGFYTIDFTLKKPKTEDKPRSAERINIQNFKYEDIYPEGLEERVKTAHNQLENYHMEQDKKNGVTDEYFIK